LIGQFSILFSSMEIGIILKCIGACALTITFVKLKMWDMVIVLLAFSLLDLSKLLILLTTP
jgi:hypothetical protein